MKTVSPTPLRRLPPITFLGLPHWVAYIWISFSYLISAQFKENVFSGHWIVNFLVITVITAAFYPIAKLRMVQEYLLSFIDRVSSLIRKIKG